MTKIDAPNEGAGSASTAFYVDLALPSATAATGGAILFLRAGMAAVHHVNRRGEADDYLAVAFPGFAPDKPGLRRFGEHLRIFGSERSLDVLLDSERLTQSLRTGLIARIPRIRPVEASTRGGAFMRTRAGSRRTVGDMMRRLERSRARGGGSDVLETRLNQLAGDTAAAARLQADLDRDRRRAEAGCGHLLLASGVSLVIRPEWTEEPSPATALVSTYGLSSPSRPSPVPSF